jgi:hypothetical protein
MQRIDELYLQNRVIFKTPLKIQIKKILLTSVMDLSSFQSHIEYAHENHVLHIYWCVPLLKGIHKI